MPSFALRNTAGKTGMAIAMLFACVVGLSACGGDVPAGDADSTAAAPGQASAPLAGQATSASQDGQVAAVPAAAAPQQLDTSTWVLPPPFYAAGQEPFWRLDIVDGWFEFRRSGLPVIEEPLVQPKREGVADVFTTGTLQVSIKREACTTDQGGHGDFAATVTFDKIDFDGCAVSGQIAASPAAASVIDELAPIDACLAKLGQPALVTAVYPRQDGEQKAVALRARNGQLYECATDAAGETIAYLDPIERGAEEPWMSRMRFLRSSVTANADCPAAEEVKMGDQVIGRLLTKSCKF